MRMVIVGSPGYLARHGVPKTPDELAQHNCLDFSYARAVKRWPFVRGRRAENDPAIRRCPGQRWRCVADARPR
ncbi:hypothetical protein [Bradyrhizobium erythrophlei]|uniref:hypothetical protein n=1 Tax=Bradyrhizobium erythrophlei TaxID=1437360 RepID=UPI003CC7CF51